MPSSTAVSSCSIQAMDADDEQLRRAVGTRIRAAREQAGLSQAALARALPGGAEGAYVSRWERGENLPSTSNLRAIAKALGVSIAWLYSDADPDPGAGSNGRQR